MYKKMPYDPARELLPVVLTTSQPNVLAVNAANPANTLPEFVAWAKKEAGKVSYGSVGNGSSSHLSMELFKSVAGFDAVHVPYAGSPPAGTSLAANETQALLTVAPALMPLVQGGRIKLLAVTSAQRMESMKTLPTFAESGFAGFEALAWNGLFAPAGTPQAVIDRINADVNFALKDPGVREAFDKQGLIVGGGSPAEFKGFIDSEGEEVGRDHQTRGHHARLTSRRDARACVRPGSLHAACTGNRLTSWSRMACSTIWADGPDCAWRHMP